MNRLLRRGAHCPLAVLIVAMGLATASPAVAQESGQNPEAAAQENAALTVDVKLSFGLEIDRATRTLVSSMDRFPAKRFTATEGSVICLSRVMNISPPAKVTHVWYHEGKTMARVDLKVGSADWRTWSSKRILPSWTGYWEVKVLDDNGMVLATSGFVVE
jgi:hypothetical protein